ncbi:MAG: hypothetical protein FDZ69_01175 [Deltaproteobacteria bacterium]|nr:MAG: hypothetical protein FDZ69_01175 [Deltaproteobacteria bacterium]
MKDIIDPTAIDGYSETRDRKYPTYIPGDARIEGFCTFSELKRRIEELEKKLEQVCSQIHPPE